jgi:quercetin dioxygenase-like cupin family protein
MEIPCRLAGRGWRIGRSIAAAAVLAAFSACGTPAVKSFGEAAPSPMNAEPRNTTAAGLTQDPTVTDGDKYSVVLENAHVRVLRYRDKPGERTHPHHHDEFVLYALSSFRRRLSFPDGTVKERDFNPGDVIWMPEQVHTGENIGNTDTDVVIVELKPERRTHSRSPTDSPR